MCSPLHSDYALIINTVCVFLTYIRITTLIPVFVKTLIGKTITIESSDSQIVFLIASLSQYVRIYF